MYSVVQWCDLDLTFHLAIVTLAFKILKSVGVQCDVVT